MGCIFMNKLDVEYELSLFHKKSVEFITIENLDVHTPLNEIMSSVKNIEKVTKKNTLQMESYIETLKQENQAIQDDLLSLRLEKSKAGQLSMKCIKAMIHILDQIDEIYKFVKVSENENWITSFNIIQKINTKSINEIGLIEVSSLGEVFNEEEHNCVKAVPYPGKRQYEILEVRKKGYRLNNEVIRAAEVIVVE